MRFSHIRNIPSLTRTTKPTERLDADYKISPDVFNSSVFAVSIVLSMTTTLPNLGFLSNEETWADQQFGNAKLAVFLTPILLATGLLLGLARTRSWLRIPLFIFASVSVYVSLTHVSPHPQFPELWAGFGLAPTLIAVLVAASYVAIKRTGIDAKILNSSRFALGTNAVALFFSCSVSDGLYPTT